MLALHRWLCQHLSPADFARIVDLSDGFGLGRERLRPSLPAESHSVAEYFHRCLRLLEQHGLLAELTLFETLAEERPLRAAEVRSLARESGVIGQSITAGPLMRENQRGTRLLWLLAIVV